MTPETAKLVRFGIIGMGAILALIAIIYLATHKFVTFAVTNPDGISSTTLTVKGADDKTIHGLFGLYPVARSQSIIKLSFPEGEETILSTKPLALLALKTPVEMKKLKQADIYTSKSLGCNTYDVASDSILTRRCATAASALYRLDDTTTKPWVNTETQSLPLGLFYYSYLNGVMAVTTADATHRHALAYSPSGMHYFALEDTAGTQADTDLAVDTTDHTNPSFAVYSATSGDVSYYNVRNQTVTSIKEYQLPKDEESEEDSEVRARCVTAGQTVFCLRGQMESPFGHQHESDHESPTTLTEIDFSQAKPAATTYKINSDLQHINDIYTDSSKTIYIKNDRDLYRIDKKRPVMVYPNALEVASGKNLIFTTDAHVYRLDSPTQARKIFSKTNLTISNLSSYGSILLFDVHSEGDRLLDGTLTFRIQEDPSDSAASIASLLPLSGKNLPIMSAAFSKNKLQIQPETFYISDRASGTLTYDQAEYDKNKNIIIEHFNTLKADGKLPRQLELLFAQ